MLSSLGDPGESFHAMFLEESDYPGPMIMYTSHMYMQSARRIHTETSTEQF